MFPTETIKRRDSHVAQDMDARRFVLRLRALATRVSISKHVKSASTSLAFS